MKGNYFNKIILILILVIGVLVFLNIKSCSKSLDFEAANTLLNKELDKEKDKYGRETARNQTLEIENKKQLKQLKESKAALTELKENISKNSQAGFAVKTITGYKIKTVTDTIIIDTAGNPVYTASDSTKWISYHIIASKDQVRLEHLKIRNTYAGIFTEKKRLLKPNQIEFSFKSYNPHTTTEEMQSFIHHPKQKRIAVGIQGGYGLSSLGPTPYIGVGISYRIVNIW